MKPAFLKNCGLKVSADVLCRLKNVVPPVKLKVMYCGLEIPRPCSPSKEAKDLLTGLRVTLTTGQDG